jgi:hypothetical protein
MFVFDRTTVRRLLLSHCCIAAPLSARLVADPVWLAAQGKMQTVMQRLISDNVSVATGAPANCPRATSFHLSVAMPLWLVPSGTERGPEQLSVLQNPRLSPLVQEMRRGIADEVAWLLRLLFDGLLHPRPQTFAFTGPNFCLALRVL